MAKANKYRRRPNGSGTIVKLSGNRRKPFMALKNMGTDTKLMKQIRKPIGYFKTWEEANDALILDKLLEQGNVNKESIDNSAIASSISYQELVKKQDELTPTFEDVWNIIYNTDILKLSESSHYNYKAAFNNLSKLHKMKITIVSLKDMQSIIDYEKDNDSKSSKLSNLKTVCSKIFRYAVIHQYVSRDNDYTSYLDVVPTNKHKREHKPFTIDEIKRLVNDDTLESNIILINIFTGLRPIEYIEMLKTNVYIDEPCNDDGINRVISYMIGGAKTTAGKKRIIPINDYIKPLLINLINTFDSECLHHLIGHAGYNDYRDSLFDPLMERLGMDHQPYDTRRTYATLAELVNMNQLCKVRIFGHSSGSLIQDTYTTSIKNKLFIENNKINVNNLLTNYPN